MVEKYAQQQQQRRMQERRIFDPITLLLNDDMVKNIRITHNRHIFV